MRRLMDFLEGWREGFWEYFGVSELIWSEV